MQGQSKITPAGSKDREAIISLLRSADLPVEDLSQDIQHFLSATDNGSLVGAIGLETYGQDGLLRSLAVMPEYRNNKIAAGLISELETLAKSLQIKNIFLLTETARGYFEKKGYAMITREEAPESIKRSSEFSHVCPASAILMQKKL